MATQDLLPVEDALTIRLTPDTNYGSEHYLCACDSGDYARSYLKFDLRGIGTITEAKIRIWRYDLLNGGTIKIYSTNNDWRENTITWNNQPDKIAEITSFYVPVNEQPESIVDITNYIKNFSGKVVSIVFVGNPSGTVERIDFSSKEDIEENKPKLIITYEKKFPWLALVSMGAGIIPAFRREK